MNQERQAAIEALRRIADTPHSDWKPAGILEAWRSDDAKLNWVWQQRETIHTWQGLLQGEPAVAIDDRRYAVIPVGEITKRPPFGEGHVIDMLCSLGKWPTALQFPPRGLGYANVGYNANNSAATPTDDTMSAFLNDQPEIGRTLAGRLAQELERANDPVRGRLAAVSDQTLAAGTEISAADVATLQAGVNDPAQQIAALAVARRIANEDSQQLQHLTGTVADSIATAARNRGVVKVDDTVYRVKRHREEPPELVVGHRGRRRSFRESWYLRPASDEQRAAFGAHFEKVAKALGANLEQRAVA